MIHDDPVAPTLNLNGSTKRDLMNDHLIALEALRTARLALVAMAPHGRDYPASGKWDEAVRQHRERLAVLMKLENEITRIAELVHDQNTGRVV
jgi:hypothetical protein